jgi:hypothetical protein
MILVPGVHLSIPPGASLQEQALIHGVVFSVANHFAYRYLVPLMEEFHPNSKKDQPCPLNSVKCPSGDCKLFSDIYGLC